MEQQQKDVIEVEGKIVEVLPNTLFRVDIDKSDELPELVGRRVLAHIAGKLRMRYIKPMEGDRVRMQMSPKYDLDKARIIVRLR